MRRALFNILLIAAFFVTFACSAKKDSTPAKHYQLKGTVVSLDSKNQTATIQHGPIEGWMEAMTMEYPIKSKQEFDQLHAGETITATVNVQGTDYDLTDIHQRGGK